MNTFPRGLTPVIVLCALASADARGEVRTWSQPKEALPARRGEERVLFGWREGRFEGRN